MHRAQLGRAAREIAIIVSSILLAIALDAWWDEFQEGRQAERLRVALLSEFEAAGEEIGFSLSRNERIIASADSLLVMMREDQPVRVSAGTVGALLLTPTTDVRRGTLDALIASGRLEILRGSGLQSLLADWPAELQDVREEELAARSFVHEQFIPFLGRVTDAHAAFDWRLAERRVAEARRQGAVATDLVVTGEIELPPSPELRSLVMTRLYLASYVLVNSETLLAQHAEIMHQLAR